MAPSSCLVEDSEHPWLREGHAPFAGKYTVHRVLGQGGMGTVFEGRHIKIGQRVAIKVLGSELREYPELVERFEREARACGSLSSAHAVRILDIDATEDGTPFIVMELLKGQDLSQLLERDGPQPVARAVGWVMEACDAIAEAHRLGIIHRDLKPSNLFLAEVDGRSVVKVLDFGIAKRMAGADMPAITNALSPLGTPQYMSPEQVRCAKDVDARSDVWSLGVTLYELVTGTTPFMQTAASACIAAIAADDVPDPRTRMPDLDDAFVDVLMVALAKSADDRYQSIYELLSAIAPFADDANVSELATSGVLPRIPTISFSDRTVPPAVTVAAMPLNQRFRSAFVLVSAAAMLAAAVGFTLHTPQGAVATAPSVPAVVFTAPAAAALPMFAEPSVAAAATTGPAPVVAQAAAPAAVVAAPAPVVAPTPIAAASVAAPAPAPVAIVVKAGSSTVATPLAAPARTDATSRALVALPLVAALGPAPGEARHPFASSSSSSSSTRAVRPVADRAATQATASRTVHGGISNPGF